MLTKTWTVDEKEIVYPTEESLIKAGASHNGASHFLKNQLYQVGCRMGCIYCAIVLNKTDFDELMKFKTFYVISNGWYSHFFSPQVEKIFLPNEKTITAIKPNF